MPASTQRVADDDLEFAERVLSSDEKAAAELRERFHARLVGKLCARGAGATEAEDIVADIWSDCFAKSGGTRLLRKFSGRSSLESWLGAVATNRLMDLKRRQRFRVESSATEDQPESLIDRQAAPQLQRSEEALVALLHDALRRVWAQMDREQLLMLRLVHLHDISQREIARMWGWHESKVSRALDSVRGAIAKGVLAEVRRADPWLQLEWQDFADLCAGATDLFAIAGTKN